MDKIKGGRREGSGRPKGSKHSNNIQVKFTLAVDKLVEAKRAIKEFIILNGYNK